MSNKVILAKDGIYKECQLGYSVKTLFFGNWIPFLRVDLKNFLIMYLTSIGLSIVFTILKPILTIFILIILNVVFSFLYNKMYIKSLISKGFLPVDEYSKNLLEKEGIFYSRDKMYLEKGYFENILLINSYVRDKNTKFLILLIVRKFIFLITLLIFYFMLILNSLNSEFEENNFSYGKINYSSIYKEKEKERLKKIINEAIEKEYLNKYSSTDIPMLYRDDIDPLELLDNIKQQVVYNENEDYLENFRNKDLIFIKYIILAKYGYKFEKEEEYYNYFKKFDWYKDNLESPVIYFEDDDFKLLEYISKYKE